MSELITVEYAGPASRQVGKLPWYDVRAWWVVADNGTIGRVKLAAGRELKRHVDADHVEFVHMDADTYNSPHLDAMLTFRVLTAAQFAARAELRSRVYQTCVGCGGSAPGQLIMMTEPGISAEHDPWNVTPGRVDTGETRALCYSCWRPLSGTCRVLHTINRRGKLSV